MKRYSGILILLSLLLMLTCISCTDEPVVQSNENNRLWFTITAPEEGVVDSRAAGINTELTINDVHVLVFDGTGDDANLLEYAVASKVDDNGNYTAGVNKNGTMYVFANLFKKMWPDNVLDIRNIHTFQDVKTYLIPQTTIQKQTDGSYLITSEPTVLTLISEPQSYTSSSGKMTFSLTRLVAKVTVKNESGNASYVLQGVNAGNVPVAGYAYPQGQATLPLGNYAGLPFSTNKPDANVSYSIEHMMHEMKDDGTTTEPLYIYESAPSNQSFVIIKGTYDGVEGYHKLALWERTTQIYHDITRNTQYIIHIKKITSAGYRTAAEAIKNEPTNRDVTFDIEVTDPSSHDIVTNGEQYLGVSNSGLIIYQSGAIEMEAAKISYTVPKNGSNQSWEEGSITVGGEGLSLSAAGATSMPLALGDINDLPVKIWCTSAFTSGVLNVRIGNLAKTIRITRHKDMDAIPEEMVFDNTTIGDCSASGGEKYHIAFSAKSGIYPSDYTQQGDVFNSGGDKLYVLLAANVGYKNNIAVRNGQFFVANAQNEGRTKVVYRQQKLDVDEQKNAQIRPYTYVGTFHRAYETAERIIRIASIDGGDAQWSAIVVVGQNFIELDTNPSKDTGIHMNEPYGYDPNDENNASKYDNANYFTADEVEANCQFEADEKGKTVISGKTDKNGTIFFRVGMKSKLAERDEADITPPRYGLIALIHGKNQEVHLIYVRQGECEDYLMRPIDPIIDFPSITRSEAVKIKPYNLTSPVTTGMYYDLPVNGGVYTEYPSQGGYFFMGNSRRAYYPVGRVGDLGSGVWRGWNYANGMDGGELCPQGYRRPDDGKISNNGYVDGSEIRQSLWLNPKNGDAQSDFGNMLRGYIADGYYDRRVMRVPNGKQRTAGEGTKGWNEGVSYVYSQETITIDGRDKTFTIPTAVGDETKIAFAGVLLYNPNNYASIFVPANGSRGGQFVSGGSQGDILGTGAQSNLWTNTYRGSQRWYLATGYYWGKYVLDNYASVDSEGFSIRCVKKRDGE